MWSYKPPKPRPESKTVKPDTVDGILLKNRNVFLYKPVDDDSASKVIKELIALDIKSQDPIYFWLNTPGGGCAAGMGIVGAMKYIKSRIITIINSEVCSMGGHISIHGNEKWIVKDGVWMAHDMSGGTSGDYSLKIKDRAAFLEDYYQKVLQRNLEEYTKLSSTQIARARTGELWLFAEDCIKYGIANKII